MRSDHWEHLVLVLHLQNVNRRLQPPVDHMLFTKVKFGLNCTQITHLKTITFLVWETATGQYCSGDLIFEDTFDLFDLRKWQHDNTLSGNGVSIICL